MKYNNNRFILLMEITVEENATTGDMQYVASKRVRLILLRTGAGCYKNGSHYWKFVQRGTYL